MFSPDLPIDTVASRLYSINTINLQGSSATRIGALLRASAYNGPEHNLRGLCWKDVTFWILRDDERQYNRIRVDFTLVHTKTDNGAVRISHFTYYYYC